jgi:hypothetical protein
LHKYDKIILYSSSLPIEELDDFESSVTLIITFDYKSHQLLSKNNIDHVISDNYITKSDIDSLQEKLYQFSHFFNESQLRNLLVYDEIQLGSSFSVELSVFLIPFFKKFLEIKKIYEKYSDKQFLSSPDLTELINLFTPNVIQIGKSSSKSKFIYDSIKLNFQTKYFSFSINVPQRYYELIKNLLDKFVGLHLKQFSHTDLANLPMLVEFDTVRYRKLLLEKNSKFLIYNRRRPTIWNPESYNIIKHSHCFVVTDHLLETTQLKNTISNEILKTESLIEQLLNVEYLFLAYFSIDNSSFWTVLKPYFIELCKKRISEAIKEIELVKQIFKTYSIKYILIWSEIGFNEQIIIKLGKKFNIPVVLFQHGLYVDTLEAKTSNEFHGVLPILSDKFLVWGESLRNYAMKCGTPAEKITVLGNPSFDELFENKNIDLHNDYILLTTQSPTNYAVNDLTVELIEKYEMTIQKICEITTKLNKKLIIKLHPDPSEFDITNLVKNINPSITVIKNGDIYSLLKKCELLIAIDISTSILEAQILGKPTVSISVKNYSINEDNCSIFKSHSCIRTEIDNFEMILHKILHDQDFRNQLIQNGNKFVDEYLSNQGTASIELAKLDFH